MLDTNAIETLAVSAVCDSVVLSPCLDEHINKKDKEPSVDGFVNLYKSGGKTKENFYGRVAVQVKGTQKKISQKGGKVKFSVEISDLCFYQKEGGVIFFFVWISSDGKRRRIFYNDLLPVKIHAILSEARGRSTTSLKFKELTDAISIERLFFAFYDEKKKQQDNLIDLPQLPSIEELQKQNVLSSLIFSVLNIEGYRDHVQAILNNDVYMYANIKGSPFPVPVGMMDDESEKAVVREVYNSVSAGNVVYEKSKVIEKLDETIINIDNWFIATFSKTPTKLGKQISLKFSPRNTLRERVKDTEFLLAFLDAGGFYLGKSFCNLKANANNINEKNFDVVTCKEQLVFMKKALQLFEILHIRENLDMTALSKNDLRELGTLILAFVDKQPINNLRNDLPFNYYVKMGGILLALYHHEKDGNKFIGDIFNANLSFGFDTDGKKHFVPAYAMLDEESWCRISNIDYKAVFPVFKRFHEQHNDPIIFNVANNTLLSILLAFDQTQKPQLLELAIELSEWVLNESSPEGVEKEIALINYLQTLIRNQILTKTDLQMLMEIAENSNIDERIRVGAYLLLDNQIAAETHFNNLDEETQQAFKSWPIYRFWKRENTDLTIT